MARSSAAELVEKRVWQPVRPEDEEKKCRPNSHSPLMRYGVLLLSCIESDREGLGSHDASVALNRPEAGSMLNRLTELEASFLTTASDRPGRCHTPGRFAERRDTCISRIRRSPWLIDDHLSWVASERHVQQTAIRERAISPHSFAVPESGPSPDKPTVLYQLQVSLARIPAINAQLRAQLGEQIQKSSIRTEDESGDPSQGVRLVGDRADAGSWWRRRTDTQDAIGAEVGHQHIVM